MNNGLDLQIGESRNQARGILFQTDLDFDDAPIDIFARLIGKDFLLVHLSIDRHDVALEFTAKPLTDEGDELSRLNFSDVSLVDFSNRNHDVSLSEFHDAFCMLLFPSASVNF